MKKILIVTAVLIAALSPLAAQGFSVGPKASLGTSGDRGEDWEVYLSWTGYENRFNFAFSAGATALFEISSGFGVQVDVLFARFGAKASNESGETSHNYNAINLPVYGRFAIPLGSLDIYALAGLDINLIFGNVVDENGDSVSASDYFDNTFWFGIAAGAGVSLPTGSGTADIGLRYRTNLSKFNTDANTKWYNQALLLDFAYRFAL